ncbi:MAG TPA: hypothetical protein PLA71_00155 [Saccharofermentans sp.]|nr:hypothetical protein [Saccharofermentans sp.]
MEYSKEAIALMEKEKGRLYENDKSLVVDIDNTILHAELNNGRWDYKNAKPVWPMINKLNEMHRKGVYIIYFTSRGMYTYRRNLRQIEENIAPTVIDWLDRHNVEYSELVFGKPFAQGHLPFAGTYCGMYIDDKAVRPREFLEMTPEEIWERIKADMVPATEEKN